MDVLSVVVESGLSAASFAREWGFEDDEPSPSKGPIARECSLCGSEIYPYETGRLCRDCGSPVSL